MLARSVRRVEARTLSRWFFRWVDKHIEATSVVNQLMRTTVRCWHFRHRHAFLNWAFETKKTKQKAEAFATAAQRELRSKKMRFCRRIILQMTRIQLVAGWRCLLAFHDFTKRRARMARGILARACQLVLSRKDNAWKKWRRMVSEARLGQLDGLKLMTQTLRKLQLQTVAAGFRSWVEFLALYKVKMEKAMTTLKRIAQLATHSALNTWKAYIVMTKNSLTAMVSVIERMLNKELVAGFGSWRRFVAAERSKAELMTRTLQKLVRAGLLRGLSTWRMAHQAIAHERRQQLQIDAERKLNSARYSVWYERVRSSTLK
jgi:hypothetical protein